MHALVHRNEWTPVDVLRSPWTAGFSSAKVVDIRGSAYVVKYSTKSLLDNTTKTRPRIRASRGYGKAVIQTDKEVVQALLDAKSEHQVDTWTDNLIEVARHGNSLRERRSNLWQFLQEVQRHNGQIHPGAGPNRPIDPETGEILLPYHPPKNP